MIHHFNCEWQNLTDKLKSEAKDLWKVCELASNYVRVYSLFPFLSLERLCLSKCSEYPFYVDFLIMSLKDYHLHNDFDSKPDLKKFSVQKTGGTGGWVDSKEIFRGYPNEVLYFLENSILLDYGAAIVGNADCFEFRSQC